MFIIGRCACGGLTFDRECAQCGRADTPALRPAPLDQDGCTRLAVAVLRSAVADLASHRAPIRQAAEAFIAHDAPLWCRAIGLRPARFAWEVRRAVTCRNGGGAAGAAGAGEGDDDS